MASNLEIELDNNANNNQPAPVLTAATSAGGSTTIAGTLQAAPNTSYLIQFFSSPAAGAAGSGEGQTLLNAGASPVTTDSTGHAVINVTLPVAVAAGQFLTATATNVATGDTSEFSTAQAILPQVSISGRDGDRQRQRHDHRDLHRQPVGALEPAGDRGLRHRRRHGARPASTTSPSPPTPLTFAAGPDPADRHGHGRRRAGRRVPQDLHREPLEPHGRHDCRRPGPPARSSAPRPCRRS